MKYLKSILEHWKDDIKVEYKREDEIREIFYGLEDIGFKIIIYKDLMDKNFGSPGKRLDFINLENELYPTYRIIWESHQVLDVDKFVEIKEEEITAIRRLSDIGYEIRFLRNSQVWVHHEDDIISKEHYTPKHKELGKGKSKFISIQDAFIKLQTSFNKIAEIEMDKDVIVITPNTTKYTIAEIHEFINRTFTRHKHFNIQRDSDANTIKVKLRTY